ncbi:hypothetical protein IX317_000604 [Fusobacterium sp. DD29]|uniref:hypothetical protein n=1 Tax=unclassified Fusobacterium TaxID=2648384 RepID=UPI001B8B150C|nr:MULTISPECIES: hypothetical protein [unclassified Fusobacterium]MBR8700274.1 hypothetical protein [Fusobacterium sp. DD45]MBR8710471.1 hypothetical protein [Fusobacterium sp. DD28]MBR8748943.1 hypothetical protein [Fusobacterium sp. DD29]MBR8751079.1 hypothetical protein [Fusobacterium sp. DD26]MBR8761249.1 hypothetical protein [Fusobacterium sp. DD25]
MEGLKIMRTVNAILTFEDSGIISDWSIDRKTNTWKGYFSIGADPNAYYLMTGDLLKTTEDTLLDMIGEIQNMQLEEDICE